MSDNIRCAPFASKKNLFLSKIYRIPSAAVASWTLFHQITTANAVQSTSEQVSCL